MSDAEIEASRAVRKETLHFGAVFLAMGLILILVMGLAVAVSPQSSLWAMGGLGGFLLIFGVVVAFVSSICVLWALCPREYDKNP